MGKLAIRTVWSNEITPREAGDFRQVVNAVFGDFCTEDYFRAKYIDNPYGPSLLFLAYLDGRPVAAEGLWRNDIAGKEAYQSVDTCVLRDCPAKGLFGAMLKHKADFAASRKDVLLYAFPNNSSLAGFVRTGWQSMPFYKALFVTGALHGRDIAPIDAAYAAWWLARRPGICRLERSGRHFLVAEKPAGFSQLLGEVDRETARRFPAPRRRSCFLYVDSAKASFYNRNRISTRLVFCNATDASDIPVWKRDSIKGG